MNTEIIHAYSRANAMADGFLIDVTKVAREAGFRVPTALTHAAWLETVCWEGKSAGQSESGRLWDVLVMARVAMTTNPDAGAAPFKVLRVPQGGVDAELVELWVYMGPGDGMEPVLTIMLPEEA